LVRPSICIVIARPDFRHVVQKQQIAMLTIVINSTAPKVTLTAIKTTVLFFSGMLPETK